MSDDVIISSSMLVRFKLEWMDRQKDMSLAIVQCENSGGYLQAIINCESRGRRINKNLCGNHKLYEQNQNSTENAKGANFGFWTVT